MTIREISQEIPKLSINERLTLLTLISDSLRIDAMETLTTSKVKTAPTSNTPITDRLTGIVRLNSMMSGDDLLQTEYADYLEHKYRDSNRLISPFYPH